MKKLSTFQIIVTGGFVFFTVIGILLFAGFGGTGGGGANVGQVTVWGTHDDRIINSILNELSFDDSRFDQVTYIEKDSRSYDEELVEALASGNGPDIFFLEQDTILRHKDKISPIPYNVMSEREFKDTFIEEGELFLSVDGIIALPFIIDPMILYWNRDHYAQAGISRPPQFWDELLSLSLNGVLTTRGEGGAILKSAFSIGEYQNIAHAKELLSTIMLQAGGSPTIKNEDGSLSSGLLRRFNDGQTPTENTLRFYTDFANPAKSVYTWNRALPEAKQTFVSGILSNYIGFASELPSIREKNANLNFDVALVPQVRSSGNSITYGKLTGLAITEASPNIAGAMQIALALTKDLALQKVSEEISLAPVSRTLLLERPSDPFKAIFADSALQSRAWLDPNANDTDLIFKTMIESVVSGRARVNEAVNTANQELENLLR
ncbi:extracellular solute-binding protein [candidate division KSB1 bacterium]